jgi:hypothetical protein
MWTAAAADPEKEYQGYGYLFGAPGVISPGGSSLVHFGGGGEGKLAKGVWFGGELGYLSPPSHWSEGIGAGSVNGAYHFIRQRRNVKLDPFVTAGYTLLFRGGVANFGNFGGGLNYWISRRAGLRLEFRDQLGSPCGCTQHLVGFRVGLALR